MLCTSKIDPTPLSDRRIFAGKMFAACRVKVNKADTGCPVEIRNISLKILQQLSRSKVNVKCCWNIIILWLTITHISYINFCGEIFFTFSVFFFTDTDRSKTISALISIAGVQVLMSQLPNICTAQAQGHVLIADWTLPTDVMNINEGCCPFRRSFGCVLLLNQIFRKQCIVRHITTLIYLINLLWKLGLGLGLDSRVALF